jgi:spore coat polysaccharide biosynthesis protein SpsF
MTRTIAIIQARLGSQRFPEKMLADLGGHTLLEWVVTRVRRSTLVDRTVVATTLEPLDDRLVAECQRLGVDVKRGSTNDVLGRFVSALEGESADIVVRVCADNPFIDPGCIDQVIREFRASGADYAFNHRPFGECDYADGFGAEVVSRRLLEQMNAMDLPLQHREHVTLAVADGSVAAKIHGCTAPAHLARPELRFDVDDLDALVSLEELVVRGGIVMTTSASDIVAAEDRRRRP